MRRRGSVFIVLAVLGAGASRPASAAPTEPLTLANPLDAAEDCRYCHQHANRVEDATEPPYGAFFGWQGSMMANAARDPVFWAAVALASEDDREQTAECVRCHVPSAFLDGRGDVISIDALEDEDLDGVTCEVCHRMVEDPVTPRGNARYEIDDVAIDGLVPRHGPFAYDDGVPVPTEDPESGDPIHPIVADPFTGSSAMCGTCHDVSTAAQRVDDGGVPMGMAFNEQRTYSEWAGSVFARPGPDARTCQDCHMPAVPDKPGCSFYVDQFEHPTGGRRHDLLGANRFMTELLLARGGVEEFFYLNALTRYDEFLSSSATLEVTWPTAVDLSQGIGGWSVTVTNETGHKLPSGYSEGRVMWLEVVARYGDRAVYSSGLWEPGVGYEEDPQLRTYRGVAEQFGTGTQNHLLRNDHWLEDTRIPPRGLTPDPQTDPVGDRYVLAADGTWPHWDTVTYAFAPRTDVVDVTPGVADDSLELSVRLLYLINTRDYVEQLQTDNTVSAAVNPGAAAAGTELVTAFSEQGWATPVVLAEASTTLPVVGLATTPPGGTTGTTGDPPPATGPTSAASAAGGESGGSGLVTQTIGSGCACRSGGGSHGWGLLWVPLFGIGLRRPGRARKPRQRVPG